MTIIKVSGALLTANRNFGWGRYCKLNLFYALMLQNHDREILKGWLTLSSPEWVDRAPQMEEVCPPPPPTAPPPSTQLLPTLPPPPPLRWGPEWENNFNEPQTHSALSSGCEDHWSWNKNDKSHEVSQGLAQPDHTGDFTGAVVRAKAEDRTLPSKLVQWHCWGPRDKVNINYQSFKMTISK